MNLLTKRNGVVAVLLIYTYLNIRLLYPFLFDSDHTGYILAAALKDGGVGFVGIVFAVFLNVITVLYFLKEK